MSSPERGASLRRASNLNLLTITPAFPIPISSDVLFKAGNSIHHQQFTTTRSRIPSVATDAAEEASSTAENQSKLFSSDNLLWDRLSLISNDSVSSASENEKSSQPVDQDKICLQMSDWLIQSMEELKWRELTEGIDFNEEVDPTLHLGTSPVMGFQDQQLMLGEASRSADYQQEEGNSVFYANSTENCTQMPTTSRVYDVANGENELSPSRTPPSTKKSFARRRRSSDTGICQEATTNCLATYRNASLIKRTNSIQELIGVLSESSSSQHNIVRRAEILRTFNIPSVQIPLRNWRPPKKKFIFELSKPIDVLTQLALQKHRCAGCGLKLDRVHSKRALYCHYYSKLFCQCCHQGAKARIPARILHEWNFKEYPVCDIAHKFLTDNDDQPVFNFRLINSELYRKTKNLRKFRKLRIKISHMWPFVQMCKIAAEQMTENGLTMFSSVPKRFLALECVDVFSLLDFECIANRNLIELIEPMALMGAAHIESCERCRQNAFLCQLCMDPQDVLFPFQLERCYRCDGCGSLAHLKCYRKNVKVGNAAGAAAAAGAYANVQCEKCERIRRKKFRLQRSASSERSAYESE